LATATGRAAFISFSAVFRAFFFAVFGFGASSADSSVVGFDFVDLQADEADAKASNNNAAPTASAQVPFEHRIKAG
jgi:hypothetical protein